MAVAVDDEPAVTLATVRIVERFFARMVAGLVPDDVLSREVTDVWSSFNRIERLASSAKTLLAARVDDAGRWRDAGARSAAEHLAKLGGTSTSQARRSLETSKQVAELPAVADAMRAGVLSDVQADAIAGAAFADPGAVNRLLHVAATTNVTELRETCLRTKTAADPDRDATHRRIHSQRCVRTFTDGEGTWNLIARGTADQGARFETALEPIIDELFSTARVEGRRELREAYAFDALMRLGVQEPVAVKNPRPRFTALLHADIEALTRGAVAGEETCEIVGVGPVPVRIARELLGDAVLKLVITKGVDVANVVHLGRGPTAAQRVALLWKKPKCANEACSSMFVQIDHREPWAVTKHTVLDETDPLCKHDHDLKTYEDWSLLEGTGRRAFVPPDDPRHPRNKPTPE